MVRSFFVLNYSRSLIVRCRHNGVWLDARDHVGQRRVRALRDGSLFPAVRG